jgi:hypothetical protein
MTLSLLVVLVVLGASVWFISAPLRRDPEADADAASARRRRREADRAELEAAREAKYREIRDAELDFQTGKLSRSDWSALDATLRAEAVEVLRRLDALDDAVAATPLDEDPEAPAATLPESWSSSSPSSRSSSASS